MIHMPSNGKSGVCPICGMEASLTTDHVVPDWLLKVVSYFGISWKDIVSKKELNGNIYMDICGPCNRAKAGLIDYKDYTLRIFIKEFIVQLQNQIDIYEGPRKLKVVCGCGRKEPCAVVPGVVSAGLRPHTHGPGELCWCGYVPKNLQSKGV